MNLFNYIRFTQAKKSSQQGQVLLIVILTMVVALTVGLSVVSRSLTNLRTSKQSEESQRAFQAAEAGIEQALKQIKANGSIAAGNTELQQLINDGGDQLGNDAEYDLEVESPTGNQMLINNGNVIDQNVGFDVWLSDYPDYANKYTGDVELYFSSVNQTGFANCDPSATKANIIPAMEILILYGDENNPQFQKRVIDPCASRTTGAGSAVSHAPGGITFTGFKGKKFMNSITVPVTDGLIMKIIPFYNSTTAGIVFDGPASGVAPDGAPKWPEQGVLISSTGSSGDVVRQLEYFLAYPQIPNELFPYSIVSQ